MEPLHLFRRGRGPSLGATPLTAVSSCMRSLPHLGAAVGLLCLVVGFAAPFDGLAADAQHALGLALFAVVFWTARPVPVEYSALLVLLLLPGLGLLSFQETFSPFGGSTIWLVFSGMVLSLMLEKSGLGHRLATTAVALLGHSRWRLFIGLHLIGLASAFLVPSGVVRVLLLMPIGIAIVDGLGERDCRSANAAVLLSLLCSTYYGGCGILTGSVPNMMVAGQLEQARGEVIYWSQWLRWMFPVIGLIRTGLCLAVVWYLFGRRMKPLRPPGNPHADSPLNSTQKKTLVILALGIGLWSTDSVHGLAPVFVGLVLVTVCLAPARGTLSIRQLREVNFPFFFYLAALFSIGSVLESSGVTAAVTDHLLLQLELAQYGWLGKHLALTAIVLPLDFLMDIAAVAGVATPSMLQLGELHGIAHTPVAMSVAMATSLVFLPYQSAPFMVALTFNRFSLGQLALCMLLISTLSFLLLCPLNVLYWRVTGLI